MAVLTLRQFVKNLDQVVQQAKTQQALKIANGALGTMEQYNRHCGRIEGMDQAVVLARDMLGQVEAASENEGLPEMPK